MDRFLSNAINKIDAKGRVSVPARFRTVLQQRGLTDLYALRALDNPAMIAGGMDLLEKLEERLSEFDPLSAAADDLSFYIHGDGTFLKIDADGRITMTDFVREHTGITDTVAFVGMGHCFQIWAPDAFQDYQRQARARLIQSRKDAAL